MQGSNIVFQMALCIVLYRIVSYRNISYRIVSYRIVLYVCKADFRKWILNWLFIILFCSTIFKVSIWPTHCSLGKQNTAFTQGW